MIKDPLFLVGGRNYTAHGLSRRHTRLGGRPRETAATISAAGRANTHLGGRPRETTATSSAAGRAYTRLGGRPRENTARSPADEGCILGSNRLRPRGRERERERVGEREREGEGGRGRERGREGEGYYTTCADASAGRIALWRGASKRMWPWPQTWILKSEI